MKKTIYLTVAILIIYCCMPVLSQAQYNGPVKYTGSSEKGTITVESTGFGEKKPESDANAVATALYILLFRGVPGSAYDLPMIPDEKEKKDHAVVKALLQGGYGTFIISDVLRYTEKRKKKADGAKGILTIHTITFNCEALRRYLEENAVIRKFGY